jgi:hypothetical protein
LQRHSMSEMSGPAAGSRCGGRLDEIGRDCPNPERINVVPLRCGVGGHVDWVCADSEPNQTAPLSDSIEWGAPAGQMIGSRAVGPQLELIDWRDYCTSVAHMQLTPFPHTPRIQERTASCPSHQPWASHTVCYSTCHVPFVAVLSTRIPA